MQLWENYEIVALGTLERRKSQTKKLQISICKVESSDFVTYIDYGDNEGPELSEASNDYDRTLKVIKVDKTQAAGKLKKGYQEI